MLPMRQSNTHQVELSTISLSILQRRGTWPFATKLPQKWTPWTLQYQRRRRWKSEWRMLKTPGKRQVLISPNENKISFYAPFPFISLFPLYTVQFFALNLSSIDTNIPLLFSHVHFHTFTNLTFQKDSFTYTLSPSYSH